MDKNCDGDVSLLKQSLQGLYDYLEEIEEDNKIDEICKVFRRYTEIIENIKQEDENG